MKTYPGTGYLRRPILHSSFLILRLINAMDWQSRTALCLGDEGLERLRQTRVILFGVGGVGSWCAEALVRSGVGHLTMVDSDCVDPSNINRQLPALHSTVGLPKVEVMRRRLLDINPEADIQARQERYTPDTAAAFALQDYDFVIDAIDSIPDKLDLILRCTRKGWGGVFLSSMGAARKKDPQQVRVSEFWRVDGCPLAAALRKRMRKAQTFPERKFRCVWSPERCDDALPKGTLMPVTAAFGLALAAQVINSEE